jgi:formate dehydrogenase maturation protein FdhE
MVQKIGFYVNLEKNALAAQMVTRYGEFLQDMPLEAQLTFRAALATFQIAQLQWHSSPNPPTRRRMIDAAIEAVNPEAWQSEQLTDWIIAFATDPKEDWRIEPMIRALCDSIACA